MLHTKTVLAVGVLFLAVPLAFADTIYLKNGMYIKVWKTQEKDGQIEYWVGSTKYSISKSAVAKIEAGNGPRVSTRSTIPNSSLGAPPAIQDLTRRDTAASAGATKHDKLELPLPKGPKQDEAYWAVLRTRIMQGDRVNEMRLAEIERDHDTHTTSNAYFLAGVLEMQRGDPGKASGYFEWALRATPDQVPLLEWHAAALAALGRYPDAAYELEHASSLQPDSIDLLRLLGLARYDADRTGDAILAWKRAMELSPDPYTERLLRKAERELKVEEESRRKESRHFTLHYAGDRTSQQLTQQLLATMENQYQDVGRQLGYEPRENIIVILYTQKEFVDITEAPSWAGALNDGKLRIPIGGVTSMNPELERVLKHELTHSFIASLAGGRCPTWLNEGVAQLMEPRSASMYGEQLGALFKERKEIPLSVLEHSFTRFNSIQAQVAYAESLSATEYLRDRYGMGEIVRMLKSIASGAGSEEALQHSTGMDYSTLEQRVGEHLTEAGRR
jgi:tetratricopeptide (TPR) repeat protein